MKTELYTGRLEAKLKFMKKMQETASLEEFWSIQSEINKALDELNKVQVKECMSTDLMKKVNFDVLTERVRQNRKWGMQRHNHGDWLKILIEEVGEVAQAMQKEMHWGKDSDADDLYKELTHVAAVASAMAEQVLEGRVRK